MKSHTSIFAIFFLLIALGLAPSAAAQEKSKGTENPSSQEKSTDRDVKSGQFVDEDGDGINDNARAAGPRDGTGQQQKKRKHRRDHFIDADGDGINDERCSGMGVGRGERRGERRGGGGK